MNEMMHFFLFVVDCSLNVCSMFIQLWLVIVFLLGVQNNASFSACN